MQKLKVNIWTIRAMANLKSGRNIKEKMKLDKSNKRQSQGPIKNSETIKRNRSRKAILSIIENPLIIYMHAIHFKC